MFDPATKILIVDDMMTMRKIVGKACKELGFTDLTEAADGALAWQKISESETPFGLIISDWNMPNCTGVELLKRIRGSQKHSATPLILVTAEAEQGQIVEAVKAGVSGYVVKPFTTDTLGAQIKNVHAKLKAA
jgi:two-component system, chemotaxis family, chemotaxis protein CheY